MIGESNTPLFFMAALSRKILTPEIEAFAQGMINRLSIGSDRLSARTYEQMLYHPTVGSAIELRILMGLSMMRDYSHPEEKIQDEVRNSILALPGSWKDKVARIMRAIATGSTFTEIAYKVYGGKATLSAIQTLNHGSYSYLVRGGAIDSIEYQSIDGTITKIPYENGLHVVNRPYLLLENDPRGYALLRAMHPYWALHTIVMAAKAVAVQRQATPILVGKTRTDDSVYLLGSNGQPMLGENGEPIAVNRGKMLKDNLESLQNSGVVVADIEDEIISLAQQIDANFFIAILKYLESMMLLCGLVPATAMGTSLSGLGDSSIAEQQAEILGLVTRSFMEGLAESLIEGIIRPMLQYNHGNMDSYGEFPIVQDDPKSLELLKIAVDAVHKGVLSAEDEVAIAKIKELIGV